MAKTCSSSLEFQSLWNDSDCRSSLGLKYSHLSIIPRRLEFNLEKKRSINVYISRTISAYIQPVGKWEPTAVVACKIEEEDCLYLHSESVFTHLLLWFPSSSLSLSDISKYFFGVGRWGYIFLCSIALNICTKNNHHHHLLVGVGRQVDIYIYLLHSWEIRFRIWEWISEDGRWRGGATEEGLLDQKRQRLLADACASIIGMNISFSSLD